MKISLSVCFLDHGNNVVEPGALEGGRGDVCEPPLADLGEGLEKTVVPVFLAESNLVDDNSRRGRGGGVNANCRLKPAVRGEKRPVTGPRVVPSARFHSSRPRCHRVHPPYGVLDGVHPLVVADNLDAGVARLLDEGCGPQPVDDSARCLYNFLSSVEPCRVHEAEVSPCDRADGEGCNKL